MSKKILSNIIDYINTDKDKYNINPYLIYALINVINKEYKNIIVIENINYLENNYDPNNHNSALPQSIQKGDLGGALILFSLGYRLDDYTYKIEYNRIAMEYLIYSIIHSKLHCQLYKYTNWTHITHHNYPKKTRNEIKIMILLSMISKKDNKSNIKKMPTDLLDYTCNWIATS